MCKIQREGIEPIKEYQYIKDKEKRLSKDTEQDGLEKGDKTGKCGTKEVKRREYFRGEGSLVSMLLKDFDKKQMDNF